MNTEITDNRAARGWILYDGACNICKSFVGRWGAALGHRGFACVPLQTDWVRERLNLPEDELMLEMRVLESSGKVVGGAAAVLLLAGRFWWALPLVWLAKLPGIFRLLDAAYRWGAARRYCAHGACTVSRRKPWYVLLPLAVPFVCADIAPWMLMWTMAAALWFALKAFTLFEVGARPWRRTLAYLAWPGMDASEFFRPAASIKPPARVCFFTALNIAVGMALIYVVARMGHTESPLLAGWLGMIGIVLVLHFGIFKGLALFWRATGVPATPIMDAPVCSRSLSEFWGRRWNTGFSIPARRYLMEPIARRFGLVMGVLTVFLVSGLVHELVISLPAKAGYGLPTLYFLIQAAGLIAERKLGPNRFWMVVCVAAPAFILFHSSFVYRVIIPFLKAIGAL